MVDAIIPADTNGIRDKAAIVGLGETEFSWNSGRSELQLASEAIKAACDDAGIAPQDIDGLVRYDMESNHENAADSIVGHQKPASLGICLLRRGRGQRSDRPCRRRNCCRVL